MHLEEGLTTFGVGDQFDEAIRCQDLAQVGLAEDLARQVGREELTQLVVGEHLAEAVVEEGFSHVVAGQQLAQLRVVEDRCELVALEDGLQFGVVDLHPGLASGIRAITLSSFHTGDRACRLRFVRRVAADGQIQAAGHDDNSEGRQSEHLSFSHVSS